MQDVILEKAANHIAANSSLGKESQYDSPYNPSILFPVERAHKRVEINIHPKKPPFLGFDCWNVYEVSWLNEKGKPIVGIAEIYYDCNTPFIVESKSLKLYFNSLNQEKFNNINSIESIIQKDLENIMQGEVNIRIKPLDKLNSNNHFQGECIDSLDIECNEYQVNPKFLSIEDKDKIIAETLYSDLLKSNCLVTNQPDWGSVQISYQGPKINRTGLLKYIVSFRQHNEFHEQCIERIFVDILNYCKPNKLTVYGRYTRRGGLDINPYRSTESGDFRDLNIRLVRQ